MIATYLCGRIHRTCERETSFLTPRETDAPLATEGEVAVWKKLEISFETASVNCRFEAIRIERTAEESEGEP